MSPVGHPRIFDMEAVLEAAMLLFWEQGYEATSLAQLRETTGLSSASLYGAFGAKEGLFEKAVEHYIAGPGSVTDVVADEAESPREAIARLLHGSITMQTDTSHPRGCLVALSGTARAPGAGEAGARKVRQPHLTCPLNRDERPQTAMRTVEKRVGAPHVSFILVFSGAA